MPTDPTARDVETARALSPCGAVPPCDKRPKRWGTCHPCGGCVLRDVIARALATARAEEREACARLVEEEADRWGDWDRCAAAIRAREGAA